MNLENKPSCECREDDNCGCSFPNNINDFNRQIAVKNKETITRIVKDSVCACSPKECACSVERTEIDN
ncbi:MAG: hypothetical protein E7012_03645 [Alphaproteobacteria bacterium]|nr:hypothetical protein [Alphaproteobacteria bacterium]